MSTPLRLNPGTLATSCWTTPQALYNEMFELGSALLGDITGIIISDDQPEANDRDKAWIKTNAGAPVYGLNAPAVWFNGHWVIKYPTPASSQERRLWVGLEADLVTYDGGAVGNALWEVDHDFDARYLIGPGTLPSTTAIAVGGTGGEETHVLTEAEGAVGTHTHPFGITNPGGDDAYFAKQGVTTVSSYTGYYITGSNGNITAGQTTADLYTQPAANGAGVTSTGHNNMPPYRGVFVIKRTANPYIFVT